MPLAAAAARLLTASWLFSPAPPLPSQEDERRFEHHVAQILPRSGRFIMIWGLFMLALWWPSDLLVFRALPAALPPFARLRAGIALACLLTLLYLRERDALSPVAQLPPIALWGFSCGAIAYFLGALGGLEHPWFHFLYLLICISVAFPINLPRRAAYTTWVGICLAAGHTLAVPASLRSPYLAATVGFLLFVVLGSILYGHLFYSLTRSNFFQAQALRRSSEALATYNERLSREVEARTGELRHLLAHLGSALEAERARISRDLHDELGQQLTAMRYELVSLRRRKEKDEDPLQHLATLEEILAQATSTTSAIVSELRPRVLDDLGLLPAVEWLAERTRERAGLHCALHIEGAPPVMPGGELATTLFRALQESLTNVARHAQANRVEITLRFTEEQVLLDVQDDGIGLQSPRPGGMGLLGMRERVRAMGGELQVESGPDVGPGTRVRCRLPFAKTG